jgi:cell wall-associated NlpC family hydrolase
VKIFGWGLAIFALLVFGFVSAITSVLSSKPESAQAAVDPSGLALSDIPENYYRFYREAGERYGLDWAILAAIGSIETNPGRSTAQGVQSGVNAYGCCAGPMQFSIVGSSSTWDGYGVDGNRDGKKSPYDPADAIPAAANYLKASGAPGDYERAIFAYNRASWYVNQVFAKADEYRSAPVTLNQPLPSGIRRKLVIAAMRTLSSRTGFNRYSQAGPMNDDPTPASPWRTDCSQWLRAIYLQVGGPDPGTYTGDQIAKGVATNNPEPGDMMFSAGGGHMEMYIGNGRTIGHGSSKIDYSNVEYYPGHFFMRVKGMP